MNKIKIWHFRNLGYLIICIRYQLQVESNTLPDNIPPAFTDTNMKDVTKKTIDIESLPKREAHQKPMMPHDCLTRTCYKRSKYWPAVLTLRVITFGSYSVQTHANILASVSSAQVQDGKTITFIKVDNTPDLNLINVTNTIHLHR